MKREEFPRSVRVACVERATRDGNIYCEDCGTLMKKRSDYQFDHTNPTRMTGDATLKNCKLLCVKTCHPEKTKADIEQIAKAKRRQAKSLGVETKSSAPPIKNRGFPKKERPDRIGLPPRRSMYGPKK